MSIQNLIYYSKLIIKQVLTDGSSIAIDGTAGNGKDTLFLAQNVGPKGYVYSFDLQKKAINRTKALLDKYNLSNKVMLFNKDHSRIDEYVKMEIDCAMFNLGYLPNSNHLIITKPRSTITAINKSLKLLKENGIITIVSYKAHYGGLLEFKALNDFLIPLNRKKYCISTVNYVNRKSNSPSLFIIEKTKI